MTEHHLNNFDEDQMHVWIPEFTRNAPEQDKLWITLCYSIALNGGFESRYEFYMHDWKAVGTDHVTDLWTFIALWNRKYGEWIKIGHIDRQKAFFIIQQENWDFIEHYVPPGLWQRKWVHGFSQLFDGQGFRYDIFETESTTGYQAMSTRYNWSSITQEDAWWLSAQEKAVVNLRLKPTDNIPTYLRPPAIVKGKRVNMYKGLAYSPITVNLKKRNSNDG